MDNMELGDLFACEFEANVAEMFDREDTRVLLRGDEFASAPYIGDQYFVMDEAHIATLKRKVCRALAARAWHRKYAPAWAQPLPLRQNELAKEWDDDLPRDDSKRAQRPRTLAAALAR
jgi:hypothetical protein